MNPNSYDSENNPYANNPYGPNQGAGGANVPPTAYGNQQPSTGYGNAPYPPPPVQNTDPTQYANAPVPPYGNPPVPPQGQGMPSGPYYPQYGQQPPQMVPPKKRRSGGVIALIVLAIVVLVGGCVSLLAIQGNNIRIASQNQNATATAQANAQSTQNQQATATAQVYATATAAVNNYPFSTSLVLNDPLSSNTKTNWEANEFCAFKGGSYHVTVSDKNKYYPCEAKETDYSNFTYEITMQIVRGDWAGITFRGNDDANKYYTLIFTPQGSYELDLVNGKDVKTLKTGSSADFNKGYNQSNQIGVSAKGSSIKLYVNGNELASVIDSTFPSGQVGTFVFDSDNPTEAIYSNAKVWKLA